MNEERSVNEHETEMHQYDEDVRSALWGPMKKAVEGGGRKTAEGMVNQMAYLIHKEKNGGLRSRLGSLDRLIIVAALVAVELAIRIWG